MDKIKLTAVMLIWGSIGIFTRQINLSPIVLAFFRAAFAIPVILIYLKVKRINLRIPFEHILPYAASGVLLGFGWATLLYGYKNTDISAAVIVYNMCPIYVMIAAPFILKEKLNIIRTAIILISFAGLFLVAGGVELEGKGLLGLVLSGLSGLLYAVIVIINRKIKHKLDGAVSALIQITVAAIVLFPFAAAGGGLEELAGLGVKGTALTLVLGVVHTGIAYSLYFSLYRRIKSIEIVSYSYLEPVFCIILGVAFLGEQLALTQIIGGVMILFSTYIGEYMNYKRESLATRSAVSTGD